MKTKINYIRIAVVVVIIISFFLIRSCNSKNSEIENLQNSNQSLIEKSKSSDKKVKDLLYVAQDYEIETLYLKEQLSATEKVAYQSETKLKQLQKLSSRPQYIPELQPCNDTIQKVYNLSIKKDSVANAVILDKNKVIETAKTVIQKQDSTKQVLYLAVHEQKYNLQIKDLVIGNDKKIIDKEKRKSTTLKIVIGGLLVLLGLK